MQDQLHRLQLLLHKERLVGEVHMLTNETSVMGMLHKTKDFEFILYILSWLNTAVLCMYGFGIPDTSLDILLIVFPAINTASLAFTLIRRYTLYEYLSARDNIHMLSPRWTLVVVTLIYLAFLPFHILAMADNGPLSLNYTRFADAVRMIRHSTDHELLVCRFFMGLSCVLVVSRTRVLSRTMRTLFISLKRLYPLLLVALIILMLFAVLTKELYGEYAPRLQYFKSYQQSAITAFRGSEHGVHSS